MFAALAAADGNVTLILKMKESEDGPTGEGGFGLGEKFSNKEKAIMAKVKKALKPEKKAVKPAESNVKRKSSEKGDKTNERK